MSKLYENIKKTEKIFHSERRFIFNIILVKVSQLENNVIHPTINFNFFITDKEHCMGHVSFSIS
jgi:hypothetical protein